MEEEEEEEEEAWLMDSLRLYNDLHLFELPGPTRVIEWTGDQRICVAGYENESRNEILQLLLPPRLLAKQNKGLCPERDFKVERGGICDRPIYRLKHVPGTSLLVTSGPPDSALQVWRVESDETDVIKLLSVISPTKTEDTSWSKIATSCAKQACILHGQRICNLQMMEVESGQNLWVAASASPDKIASLDFLDEVTAVVCGAKGQLFLVDFRQHQGILGAVEEAQTPWAPTERLSWCAGIGSGETPLIARLSSAGLVVLTDIRYPSSPLKVAQCCVPTPNLRGADFLSISFAPVLGNTLAVSGFDGTVQVYNTKDWDSSRQEAKPVFIHKGHTFGTPGKDGGSPMVTTHTWHPWKPQTLLSAASDGSLHVWDWSDLRASEPGARSEKQTMSLEDLSATNRNLRLQIEELTENVAYLESENQDFLRDKEHIKEQQRCLRETVDDLKSTMEQLQKTVEDIREKLDLANAVIHELALQNKSLVKVNKDLNEEMHEATSQVAVFKNDKPAHENDFREMRNLPSEVQKYLRNLEDKLAENEHNYCVEKNQSGQLKEKVATMQKVRENLRKRIKDLQKQRDLCVQQAMFVRLDQENQMPAGILTHELLEARLVGVARDRSKKMKFLHWLWMAVKILMLLLFGCCLFVGLVLAYTHFFNPLFISETLVMLLSDQSINRLVHRFSPYLEERNDGLLPF